MWKFQISIFYSEYNIDELVIAKIYQFFFISVVSIIITI